MNDDVYIVTINGVDYYCTEQSATSLKVVNGKLINQGSTSITLYASFPEYNNSSSGYPRITCPVNTQAYYRSSYNATVSTVQVNSISFNKRYLGDNFLMSVMIFFALIVIIFKR